MSQFIDQLKSASGDPRSTQELTLVYGDQLSQEGRNDVFANNPDFANEYQSIKDNIARMNRPSLGQEFMGGLKAGGDELASAGWGLGALAANAVGADQTSQSLLAKAREDQLAAEQYAPSVPSIASISGDHPIEDTTYYLARGAGGLVPSLGLAAGAGLAGGLIGSAAEPGGGTIAGTLAGIGSAFTGEGAAANLIRLAASKGIQLSAEDATALAIKQAAQRIGSEAALGAAFSGQSAGANFVRHPETPGADLAFGVGSGVLGALAPGYVLGKILPGAGEAVASDLAAGAEKAPAGYVARFVDEATKTIPIGATSTAGSALIDMAADKYAKGESPTSFTADDWRNALNAGVIGGLGGLAMAPFAAIRGGSQDSAVRTPTEAEPTPKIDTTGLPDDIKSAVETAEQAASAINPKQQPSALREAANNAVSIQGPSTVPMGDQSQGGSGILGQNQVDQVATGARESGAQTSQAQPLARLIGQQVEYAGYKGTLIRDEEGNFGVLRPVVEKGTPNFVEVAGTGKDPQTMAADVGVKSLAPIPEPAQPELKPVDPNWRVTVQTAIGDIPGYVQIDKIGPKGEGLGSYSPEQLASEGYAVPAIDHLPTGQFTFDEAAKLRTPTPVESSVPIPSSDDILPAKSAVGLKSVFESGEALAPKELPAAPVDTAVPSQGSDILPVGITQPSGAVGESAITPKPEIDVSVPAVRDAINSSTALSPDEKANVLATGSIKAMESPVPVAGAPVDVVRAKILSDAGFSPQNIAKMDQPTADKLIQNFGRVGLDLTQRVAPTTSSDYIQPPASAANILTSTVRALAQDRGVPVVPITKAVSESVSSAVKTAGLTLTPETGGKLVAYSVDSVHGPVSPTSIIPLLHEAGHVFTDGLDEPLRVGFQQALEQLPWDNQRWLNNPDALDARLIATADPATLSSKQVEALRQMTPEEIAAARALPADVIASERMAEHLAQLGWDKQAATGIVDRFFRFVKDLWFQTGMAIQKVLKGTDQINPELVRQFVENRFLQFINRDAAYAPDRINDLLNWIGVPQTVRERQPNFPAGADSEMRMQFADKTTGTLIPVSYGTYTPDSLKAYLQRAVDNAARFVREKPNGAQTPEEVQYTRRVNLTKPMPFDVPATANVKLANLNLEEEVYQRIRAIREIAAQLPRVNGKPIDHATFLKDWLSLPDEQQPANAKVSFLDALKSTVDPETGKPVAFNADQLVRDLPGLDETLKGQEGEAVKTLLSEQQDESLTQTILSLRDTQQRAQRALESESSRLDALLKARDNAGTQAPKELNDKIGELQRSTLLRSEIIKRLEPEINALESKFDPAREVKVYAGGDYLTVPHATADASEIDSAPRGKIPFNLDFSGENAKSVLGQHLADMEQWLAQPENRLKGPIYGTVAETYRKLMQIPTDLKVANTKVLLRRTITQGLHNETRLTGIPNVVETGKRVATMGRVISEHRVEAELQAVKWQRAWVNFGESLGRSIDQSLKEDWWDPIAHQLEQIDISKQAELKSGGGSTVDIVANKLKQVAGLEIKTQAQRDALRDLILATADNNRSFQSWELEHGIKVADERLGFQRRLVPRGLAGGVRRTLSRRMTGLFARMNPDWSDTSFVSQDDPRSFYRAAADLYSENRSLYDQNMKRLFTSYAVKDFVEPWALDSKEQFQAPTTKADPNPRVANDQLVRQAWREGNGDVTAFAERLHALEGGDKGDERQTVGNVIRTLFEKYNEIKSAVDQQIGAQRGRQEIIPRQLMDARKAQDWPAAFVNYATYTPTENAIVLSQLAMGTAFGHGGLGPTSELHMQLANARREIASLWSQHEELVAQGKSKKEIDAIMGADKAGVARKYYALDDNIKNIEHAFIELTTHNGYLMQDFKAMTAAVQFMASMTLQNPRSGALNTIGDTQGSLASLKFSKVGLKAFKDSVGTTAMEMANSLVRAFGANALFNSRYAEARVAAGAIDADNFLTWRDKLHLGPGMSLTKPSGYESVASKVARLVVRGAQRGRDIASNVGSPLQAASREGNAAEAVTPKLRAGLFGTTAQSTLAGNAVAGYNLFGDLALRGVKYVDSLPASTRDAFVRELELGTRDLDARQLDYQRSFGLSDEAAFQSIKFALETQIDGEQSVGRFVAKAFRRREAAGGGQWQPLSNSQFAAINNHVNTYWTLNPNIGTLPNWMSGSLRPLFTFLTWPYQAMQRFGLNFTDPQGRVTNTTIADGMKTFFLLAAPATIASSFAIDLYDKYALGKKQNLREASLVTALPGIGAIADPHAFLERVGRYGGAGFASDIANEIVNYDTQRNLSLDSRVVAISQIKNLFDSLVLEPFQTGGNLTYASTVRPFLQAVGAGGVLQYLQIGNHLLGLNNEEAAINNQINVTNYLRAAGRELKLPVRVMSGPMQAPTPLSPYIREMSLAAIVDNPSLFQAAYQRAVEVAQSMGKDAKEVASQFNERHPLRRAFASTPTDTDYRQMLALMGSGAADVRQAVNNYNKYASAYFNKPAFYGRVEKAAPSVDQLIREATSLSHFPDYSLVGQ